MCMTDAGTAQDYFIHPSPPVGGLPLSQDRLDRMKLVHDRTIPTILPSEKKILVNMVFKIRVGYTNLTRGKSKAPNANMSEFVTVTKSFKDWIVLVWALKGV